MYPEGQAIEKSGIDGALEELDRQLDRFEKAIDALAAKVLPISSQYASSVDKMSEPRPEPSTQLRGRIERLQDRITRVEQITNDIDL